MERLVTSSNFSGSRHASSRLVSAAAGGAKVPSCASDVGKRVAPPEASGRTSPRSRSATISSSERDCPSAAMVCCSETCVPTRKGAVLSESSVLASSEESSVAGRYGM